MNYLALGEICKISKAELKKYLPSTVNYHFGLTPQLIKEYDKIRLDSIEFDATRYTLRALSLIQEGNTKDKIFIRNVLNLKIGQESFVNQESLKQNYKIYNISLDKDSKKQTEPTASENYLFAYLKKYLKKLGIHQSTWIGNHNVDLFIPWLNLAFEVDGEVHDREFKIVKDQLKDRTLLKEMKIKVYRIQNHDVYKYGPRILEFITRDVNKISGQKSKRLNRNIYIETIIRHYNIKSLSEMFHPDIRIIYDYFIKKLAKSYGTKYDRKRGKYKKRILKNKKIVKQLQGGNCEQARTKIRKMGRTEKSILQKVH